MRFNPAVLRLSAFALLLTPHVLVALPFVRRDAAARVPSLSGAQTIMGSGTYPRANFLQDGSIIGTYTAFEDGDSIITLTHSTDGGSTWSTIGEAARGETATHDIDNPYVLQLPTGRVLVAFRNHDKDASGAYTTFRITICSSDDSGVTWSFLSTPASDPGPVTGNWEPFLRLAADGTLQLYYSRENNANDQDSLMRTSTDGGSTWSTSQIISGADLTSSRDGMLGVATVSGSTILAVFETETNGGQFTIGSVLSNDDGATWGTRRSVYVPAPGARANAPQLVNVGGTLVVSFQTDEDTPGGDFAGKVLTSDDGGGSWGKKLTFSAESSMWPGLIELDDSTLIGMADHGGAKAQKITLG
ncbi:MAG: hypothetical protein MMC23_004139 [Stictis urceolatum]|nr:hypothetical protein [Stictis urceolata]